MLAAAFTYTAIGIGPLQRQQQHAAIDGNASRSVRQQMHVHSSCGSGGSVAALQACDLT
jgi:hypothetical protein